MHNLALLLAAPARISSRSTRATGYWKALQAALNQNSLLLPSPSALQFQGHQYDRLVEGEGYDRTSLKLLDMQERLWQVGAAVCLRAGPQRGMECHNHMRQLLGVA